jgi:hypothetical protein
MSGWTAQSAIEKQKTEGKIKNGNDKGRIENDDEKVDERIMADLTRRSVLEKR